MRATLSDDHHGEFDFGFADVSIHLHMFRQQVYARSDWQWAHHELNPLGIRVVVVAPGNLY